MRDPGRLDAASKSANPGAASSPLGPGSSLRAVRGDSYKLQSKHFRAGRRPYPRTNGSRVVGLSFRARSALATAGAMTGVPGSPTPVGLAAEGTI